MAGTWWNRWLKQRTPALLSVVAALALLGWAIGKLPHPAKTHSAIHEYPYLDTGAPIPGSGPTLARFPAASAIPVGESLQRGETLSQVFGRLGLDPSEAHAATQALVQYANPRQLRAGDDYSAYFDHNERLANFRLTLERRGEVRLSRSPDGWRSHWYPYERTERLRRLSGEIRAGDSLEAAIARAGGDPALAYAMADVLQWDVDFTRDLRVGDKFTVLYQEVYLDGTYDSIGDIEALSFENRGEQLEAYRFGKDGDYFGPDGRPLKKMFLRAPLRYTRITSRFTNRRYHPILHRFLPHHGVDYGAPIGTPVRVTANGTVLFRGWDRGGGRTVKVRHSQGYVTEYLHLSRFAR
ncbi:MAG TPA: peptidoglycan DD-metalloendopeptidase family protein, partial [Thermoanaerobaculia bacterium]|nr:peptidoglycan DD-metalloendopeptidase family protein [Thermoanaerobaculia bacterium]